MITIPTIQEQKERGLKFMAEVSPDSDPTDEEAIIYYKKHLRVGLCFGADHTLRLIKTALQRHEQPEKWVSENSIDHTLKCSAIRYFPNFELKETYLMGVEDTRRMHDTMPPEVIDFLEQYLSSSSEKS